MQPKYIPQFVAKQLEGDYDVVTGTRYAQSGGVAGWDTRRKLTSRGANFCAATMLNPGVTLLLPRDTGSESCHGRTRPQQHARVAKILLKVQGGAGV